MLFVAIILATIMVADPPPSQAKPEDKMPEHFQTYGKERSAAFFSICKDAGAGQFTNESIERYCMCHVYIMEEVIPFPELEKLSKDDRSKLFLEITKGCKKLGAVPIPVPKDVPKTKPAPPQDDKSFWI